MMVMEIRSASERMGWGCHCRGRRRYLRRCQVRTDYTRGQCNTCRPAMSRLALPSAEQAIGVLVDTARVRPEFVSTNGRDGPDFGHQRSGPILARQHAVPAGGVKASVPESLLQKQARGARVRPSKSTGPLPSP